MASGRPWAPASFGPTSGGGPVTPGASAPGRRHGIAGNASFNTLTGHAVGVQIVDQATPLLDGNIITDSKEAGVVFGDGVGAAQR